MDSVQRATRACVAIGMLCLFSGFVLLALGPSSLLENGGTPEQMRAAKLVCWIVVGEGLAYIGLGYGISQQSRVCAFLAAALATFSLVSGVGQRNPNPCGLVIMLGVTIVTWKGFFDLGGFSPPISTPPADPPAPGFNPYAAPPAFQNPYAAATPPAGSAPPASYAPPGSPAPPTFQNPYAAGAPAGYAPPPAGPPPQRTTKVHLGAALDDKAYESQMKMVQAIAVVGVVALLTGGVFVFTRSRSVPTPAPSPEEEVVESAPSPSPVAPTPAPSPEASPSPSPSPSKVAGPPKPLPSLAAPTLAAPRWNKFDQFGFSVMVPAEYVDSASEKIHVTTRKRVTLRIESRYAKLELAEKKTTLWAASIRLVPDMGTPDDVFAMFAATFAEKWSSARLELKPFGSDANARQGSSDLASGAGRLHVRLFRNSLVLYAVVAIVPEKGEPDGDAKRFLDGFKFGG